MKTEFKDISHGKNYEGRTFDHHCVLAVKTTDDNGSVTETKEQGYMIQGKDCIYLNAPKIYPSKDTPLLTEAPDIVGVINELFMSEPGGGDDWQPPPWWIPVPEPEPYDIYMLIKAPNEVYNGMQATFRLYKFNQSGSFIIGDDVYCNWGDGTEEIYSKASQTHTYADQGMYLIHIVGNETTYVFDGSIMKKNLLIFKAGEKIECSYNSVFASGFASQQALSYVKINNLNGMNIANSKVFQACNALKKIVIKNKADVLSIGQSAFEACKALEQVNFENCNLINKLSFANCTSIKTVSFPNVTSIGDSAFSGCSRLQKAYFPNCKSIGSQAFYSCNNLQEIIVHDDCVFGNDCFRSCYSLYPRPDGSVN